MSVRHRLIRLITALAALALPLAASAISPDDFNALTIVNGLSTGDRIEYLFSSPGDSQYWGPDLLDASHALDRGVRLTVHVFYPDASASFDFLAVDSRGRVYEVNGVEISDGRERQLVIADQHLTNRSWAAMPKTEVLVANETASDLEYLFFAPADSRAWGMEMLNSCRTLRSGEETSFIVLNASDRFELELLGIAGDGSEFQKTLALGTGRGTLLAQLSVRDRLAPGADR